MSDSALNYFIANGTNAERLAFTPSPPSVASGPPPLYVWVEDDTGDAFYWDTAGSAWAAWPGSGGITQLTGDVTAGPGTGSQAATIANGAVTLAKLANQADSTLLANISGGAAAPTASTLSAILDALLGSTQGDVAFRGASAWSVLAPGTAGQLLTTGGAGADPSWVNAAGGGAVAFVGSSTVTGSPASALTLSGLDLDADGVYFFTLALKNATTSTSNISVFYNSDVTATDYDRIITTATPTAVNAARGNDAIVCGMDSNAAATGSGNTTVFGLLYRDVDGYVVLLVFSSRGGFGIMQFQQASHEWRTPSVNVTGLTLSASVASSLGVDSNMNVWKYST